MRGVVKVSNRIKTAGALGISYFPSCPLLTYLGLHTPRKRILPAFAGSIRDEINILRPIRLAFIANAPRVRYSQKICILNLFRFVRREGEKRLEIRGKYVYR